MIVIRLFIQTVFFAIRQMLANKVRSMLTTLGIVIGVWAISTVISAVGGLRQFVLDEFAKFGATKMFIWGERPISMEGKMSWRDAVIRPEEAIMLRENSTYIKAMSLETNIGATVRHGQLEKPGMRVVAIEPDWFVVENVSMASGRPFTQNDLREELHLAIVNEQAVDDLRLDKDGVGQYIDINDRRFLIIGQVETKEMSGMFGGGEARGEIYVPVTMAPRLENFSWFEIKAAMRSPEDAEDCKNEVEFLLRRYRELKPGDENTFGVFQMTEAMDSFKTMAAGMTVAAGVLVGISLLVGGIGIMNIMLVSVSERTREIGLRKALGASPAVVLVQFLVEAVILCVFGGLIGLILGQVSTLGLRAINELKNAEIPLWAILLAFGFSGTVGVVFGMWPAIKAARLNPIEALRHE